ncbi:MAG: hypothetical protein HY578_03705 [Nitrospinae bacterium]|nr:hypothetical protein [Nitrospinota bacterium]
MSINAKESMPGGGVLGVYAKNIYVNAGDNVLLKEGNYVRVSLRDSGKGIPEANLPKIFDPYFSTKEMRSQKGIGLGLSICYSIIKKHNGIILLESEVGIGTIFHVYILQHMRKYPKKEKS